MNQREKFEAWHNEKFRWMSKRDDIRKQNYLDHRTQGLWEAWQAAIAAQEPKQAMTDAALMRLAGDIKHRNAGVWPGDVAFARAIIAASSPNKDLVEALQQVMRPYGIYYVAVAKAGGLQPDFMEVGAQIRAALKQAGAEVT